MKIRRRKEGKSKCCINNPCNLPGLYILDAKTNSFKKKTKKEKLAAYEFNLDKYLMLKNFRIVDPEKTETKNKHLNVYLQLEAMCESFMIKHGCSEENIVNVFKQQTKEFTYNSYFALSSIILFVLNVKMYRCFKGFVYLDL